MRTPHTGRCTHLQVTAATPGPAWLPNADPAHRELASTPLMTESSWELMPKAAGVAWHPRSSVSHLCPLPWPCLEPWVAASFLPSCLLIPGHMHRETCSPPRATSSAPEAATPGGSTRARPGGSRLGAAYQPPLLSPSAHTWILTAPPRLAEQEGACSAPPQLT